MNRLDFLKDLAALINRYSIEGGSNTPDFILADYMLMALENYEAANNRRERWYGRDATPVKEVKDYE